MSDIAIRVEDLSKRYLLGHQANAPKGEVTMRDKLVGAARGLLRRTHEMARGGALVAGDSIEEFWALKDVSFEVKRGEVLGIIGRNGAGKSTLLKILSRITDPTSGRITLNGRVSSLLEVGTGFHPELSGRENVFLNGAILGMSRKEIQKKFDEIVDFAEVEKFLDTPVKRYSSGMYVRLAFGVAAHLEPEILVVDEVLAVGDVQFQKKCLGKMQSVAGEGRTVLFVSHNMSAVENLTSTSVMLSQGKLSMIGETKDVVSNYLCSASEDYSKTEFDVSSVRRKNVTNQKAFIEKIKIKKESSRFEFGEKIFFVASTRFNSAVTGVKINIVIFSNDGNSVGVSFSSNEISAEKDELADIEVTLDNHRLSPGGYFCNISIGQGTHETGIIDFDLVKGIMGFEIKDISTSEGASVPWNREWGNISFPMLVLKKI